MSRGPGAVARAIEVLFRSEPDGAFTTEDLCERIFPGVAVEKKHRVSILRAARDVVGRMPDWRLWRSEQQGGPMCFLNLDSVTSYALGRLKCDSLYRYRSKRSMWGVATDADLLALLEPGGRYHQYVAPDGAWWIHTETYRAERDGDPERAARMRDELNADIAIQMRKLQIGKGR